MPPRDDTPVVTSNLPPSETAPATRKPPPKKRLPLSPLPILDRNHLLSQYPDLKPHHVSLLYQHLHRQNYPPLPEFLSTLDGGGDGGGNNPTPTKKVKNHQRLPRAFVTAILSPPNNPSHPLPFATLTSTISSHHTSSDGTTTKLTVALQDGHHVETVVMRHAGRVTVCVSSQVGCAMKCTFCATGTMGLSGNLCQGEILEQLVHARRVLDMDGRGEVVRNVVFMGMGEPLDNYEEVVAACRALMDRKRWGLSYGRVTVSTVGVTPFMLRLSQDLPEVNMAVSLHAPEQKMREGIVPSARRWKIEGIIEALDGHVRGGGKRRKGMIEYIMLEGPTSTFECAHLLGELCKNRRQIVVNLIPYNQTNVRDVLRCPSEEHVNKFQSIVTSYGVQCYVRRTMGADIAGACGQLVVQKDIEDLGKGCSGGKSGGGKKGVVTRKKRRDLNKVVEENDMDKWVKPLLVATAVSGCCFVLSLGMWILKSQQRRRR